MRYYQDTMRERLFEMRLMEIYNRYSWLSSELTLKDFIALFPVIYKNEKALLPDKPSNYDLDKNIFLEVLVAFRQSFS